MSLPRAKKSYGQHFLVDPAAVRKILDAAEITPGETVLEIGPGTGILTEALVEAGARVIAVESDPDLIPDLQVRFGDAATLVQGDILSLDLRKLLKPLPYKLVANIPYNITSEIIRRFLAEEPRPSRMVLLVQREVADRITVGPPGMGLLSVVCQLYADVKKVAAVPRGAFRPMPKVDSAVVRFDLVTKHDDPEAVIKLAKAGFSSPRKQLHRNLAAAGIASSEEVKSALASLGLDPKSRAGNLRPEDWVRLYERTR